MLKISSLEDTSSLKEKIHVECEFAHFKEGSVNNLQSIQIRTLTINGKTIIQVHIPQALREHRPVT